MVETSGGLNEGVSGDVSIGEGVTSRLRQAVESTQSERALNASERASLRVLEDLHLEHLKVEEAYRHEWNLLKLKYFKKMEPLYAQRHCALNPNAAAQYKNLASLSAKGAEEKVGVQMEGEEGEKEGEEETGVTANKAVDSSVDAVGAGGPGESATASGDTSALAAADASALGLIDGFWLTAMKHHCTLAQTIESYDEPILKYVENVRFEWKDEKEQLSFKIEMQFRENPFFSNKVLTKEFELEDDSEMDESVLTRAVGTSIDWFPGKNVLKKIVAKKQRNRRTGEQRLVNVEKDRESFFHFFSSHQIPDDDKLELMRDSDVRELENTLEVEYELGCILRDRIIPHALGWFLNLETDEDALEHGSDSDSDAGEGEGEGDGDSDDDDEDEDAEGNSDEEEDDEDEDDDEEDEEDSEEEGEHSGAEGGRPQGTVAQ